MNKALVDKLSIVTEEEHRILENHSPISQSDYTMGDEFIVDSHKIMKQGQLIQIRPHTRFTYFPKHKHNYVEVVYMVQGSTTHIVNNEKVVLEEGELLFLNQNATQEILPAGKDDIAVNFTILPNFFDVAFQMISEGSNFLRDFFVSCLTTNHYESKYLHFKVSQILPVQNLIENLVWTIMSEHNTGHNTIKVTMGLLLMQLENYLSMTKTGENSYEHGLMVAILTHIEDQYREGTLQELAERLGYELYWLSRKIKKLTGYNYKTLVQEKRLKQSAELLKNSKLSILEIVNLVGYSNASYFYRIFRDKYGLSPKSFRDIDCK